MSDDNKPLGSMLRRHLRAHKSIGVLRILAEQILGETLEKIGSGIERKLDIAMLDKDKKINSVQRIAAIPLIGAAMAEKLLDKMIVPELRRVNGPKETAAKLYEINDVLSSMTDAELEAISKKTIDESLTKTKVAPKAPRKRPRPQTRGNSSSGSSSSSSGGFGGKSGRSWGSK